MDIISHEIYIQFIMSIDTEGVSGAEVMDQRSMKHITPKEFLMHIQAKIPTDQQTDT
jgi:hypothetical protein